MEDAIRQLVLKPTTSAFDRADRWMFDKWLLVLVSSRTLSGVRSISCSFRPQIVVYVINLVLDSVHVVGYIRGNRSALLSPADEAR